MSPFLGYRYDGLYRIDTYWREKGVSGFYVWRFRLVKVYAPPITNKLEEGQTVYGKTKRVETFIQRIIRDTALSTYVKEMYAFQCQICQAKITTNTGLYAEAAHIQPLGMPHDGPDVIGNILCLCPNHHVMFDFGGFGIADDLSLIGLDGTLYRKSNHFIESKFLHYHRDHFMPPTCV